jgi:hypothetical protein
MWEEVVAAFNKINSHLVFTPPGGTRDGSPLDVRVNGAVKSKGNRIWHLDRIIDPFMKPTLKTALKAAVEAFYSVSQKCITDGFIIGCHVEVPDLAAVGINPEKVRPMRPLLTKGDVSKIRYIKIDSRKAVRRTGTPAAREHVRSHFFLLLVFVCSFLFFLIMLCC